MRQIRAFFASIALVCFATIAHAQATICPITPDAATSNQTCANTAFVHKAINATSIGTITAGSTPTSGIVSGDIIGSSGNLVVDTGVAYADVLSGPGSSTSGHLATWNGTGGNVLGDSGGPPAQTISLVSHEWLNSYNASTGSFSQSQPAFADISGTLTPSSQMPTSGVTAGSYTAANITVTAQGLVTAAANGSGGGGVAGFVSSYVSGNWYLANNVPSSLNSGSTTGTGQLFCAWGVVSQSVTIKALGVWVATGTSTTNAQFAVYQLAGGNITLVDTTVTVSVASSGAAATASMTGTTDTLSPNVLYGFCHEHQNATAYTTYEASQLPTQAQSTFGASTVSGLLNTTTGSVLGTAIAETFGTFPSSIAVSSLTLSNGRIPVVGFQVNWLLRRDLKPAANGNSPAFLSEVG